MTRRTMVLRQARDLTKLPPDEVRVLTPRGKLAHIVRGPIDPSKAVQGALVATTLCGKGGVYRLIEGADVYHGCGRCYAEAHRISGERRSVR